MAEYKIVIEAPNDDGTKKPTAPSPNPAGNAGTSTKSSKTEKGLSMLSSKVSGVAVYKYAKSAAQATAHQVTPVEIRTGNEVLQREARFAFDAASTAFGIVESIVMGVVSGGPAGAAAAVLGTVGQLTMAAIEIGQNQKWIDTQQAIEAQQRRLCDIRSGVMGDRSSALARGL